MRSAPLSRPVPVNVNVNMNVRAQSLTTMAPRLQVQGTDANLGKSKRILNAMSRRVMTNQLVMVLVRAPLHMPQYNAAGVLENVRRAQARATFARRCIVCNPSAACVRADAQIILVLMGILGIAIVSGAASVDYDYVRPRGLVCAAAAVSAKSAAGACSAGDRGIVLTLPAKLCAVVPFAVVEAIKIEAWADWRFVDRGRAHAATRLPLVWRKGRRMAAAPITCEHLTLALRAAAVSGYLPTRLAINNLICDRVNLYNTICWSWWRCLGAAH